MFDCFGKKKEKLVYKIILLRYESDHLITDADKIVDKEIYNEIVKMIRQKPIRIILPD